MLAEPIIGMEVTTFASVQRRRVYIRRPVAERFLEKVLPGPSGCWEWLGARHPKGYGSFHMNDGGRTQRAHRVAYELFVGPIPEGLEIDHLCRNRGCVNPGHLQPVTGQVNQLRGLTVTRRLAERMRCNHGHEFTPENTYWKPKPNGRSYRQCRECHRQSERVTGRNDAEES